MKKLYPIIILAFLFSSCQTATPTLAPDSPTLTPTSALHKPNVNITSVPDAQAASSLFLESWKSEDYTTMYGLLSQASAGTISAENFNARYRDTALNMTLQNIEVTPAATAVHPTSAQTPFSIIYRTQLFGDLQREMKLTLVLENNQWRVDWNDGLILPELQGGNKLVIEFTIPDRANIFDHNGEAIAAPVTVYSLGLQPGKIDPDSEQDMVVLLAKLTGKKIEDIYESYAYAAPDWYIPVGLATSDGMKENRIELNSYPAVVVNEFSSRYSYELRNSYYNDGLAPQTTGYVLAISSEQLEDYRRLGYRGDEKVGVSGLEKWGEGYLAGSHGASVNVVSPEGQALSRLLAADTQPSQSITTTLDYDLQMLIQRSMGDYRGAVVVMERDTGKVLAMVSSPGFDPNAFQAGNSNATPEELAKVLNNPEQPLLNRAAQSGYPLGSVFKVITMAAALESGVFNDEMIYECTSDFRELPGEILDDWTKAKGYKPSGPLTLSGGLIRSCNPWFYHIGLELYRLGYTRAISDMSRAFGLGKETGIGQVAEDPGFIPDPADEREAVQLSIGQGQMLVTPLQVARLIAAIGNGGTLYRPNLVQQINRPDGTVALSFQPEIMGTLPVSPENLKIIQTAMEGVAFSRKPRGTAFDVLYSLQVPVAGKTGTATTSEGDPHSWFGGYTNNQNDNRPNIAVAIILENAGEGSEYAAPLFKRIVELYYSDYTFPGPLLPWESKLYTLASPTPIPSATPTGTPTPVGTPAP
ncbi:MAG: penicillin-binding transpeptidase domain-containing protein [Anaerolineaceae bacterium]